MDAGSRVRDNEHVPVHEKLDRLLSSWKEIADFLQVSTRTAQQYEKTRRLPVKRSGSRPTVLESELKAWQLESLRTVSWWEKVRVLQICTVAATLLFFVTAAAFGYYYRLSRGFGNPVSVRWNGSALMAHDDGNRLIWSRVFPHPMMEENLGSWATPWIGDLDADGKSEILILPPHVKRESEGWDLHCLSSDGKQLWQLRVSRTVANRNRQFAPPYVLRGFSVFPSPEDDDTFWVAAVFVHHVDYPAVLMVVDSSGKTRGEYWHPGHLSSVQSLDLNGDGVKEILTGGIQHGYDQAVMIIFDPRMIAGSFLGEDSASYLLRDFEAGTEKAIVYFPRTSLNRKLEQFNYLESLEIINGIIQASVYERLGGGGGYLVYQMTKDLVVQHVTPSVSFRNAITTMGGGGAFRNDLAKEELDALPKQVRVVRR